MKPHLLATLVCVVVVGCATPPPPAAPRTTVILLPDEDGQVGAVSVTTAAGSQQLDRAFTAATVQAAGAAPSASDLGREGVDAAYGDLLKAQPAKPLSFTLNFLLGKTVLTDEAKAQLPALLDAVRSRKPTEITVFGHADASGTEENNFKLSAERARVVADLLRKSDPALDKIEIQSFGDKMPLVPSLSRGATPRNRRAEVMLL